MTGKRPAGYRIRMPSDRDVVALSTWDAQDEPSDPYDQPMCDCCERVEVNRPGDICAACEPETGRNSAADGAGDGASLQVLDDHPSPAPACWQCGSMMDDDGYCANCADVADAMRTDHHADPRPSRPEAPSLPMDLCSDIPEDD